MVVLRNGNYITSFMNKPVMNIVPVSGDITTTSILLNDCNIVILQLQY